MQETAHNKKEESQKELQRQLDDLVRIKNSLETVLGTVNQMETTFKKNPK